MKLTFYNNYTLGVIDDENIMDVSAIVSDITPCNPQGLLETVIMGYLRCAYRGCDVGTGWCIAR